MPKAILVIVSVLAIIILLVVTVSVVANAVFSHTITEEVRELFNKAPDNKKEVITKADLVRLPLSVQRWLEQSQVVGKEKIRTVRLKQRGLMRLKEDAPWMPVEAEQYFTVDEPGFIWKAKIKMAPLVYFTGRDKYYEGRGNMLIKVLSLYPVANSSGKEMDQGTLLRYLAEMPWFPTGALNNYIKWEEVDANSARATMSYKGVRASGVFTYNGKGEVVSFLANRYREVNGKYELTDWGGLTRSYKDFNGIRIPNKTDVIWRLETGDFNWYKCEITEIEYNRPEIY